MLARQGILAGFCVLVALSAPTAAQAARGPLDPLTGPEIRTVFRVVEADSRFPDGAFFPTVNLKEPPKAEVLAWSPGESFRREAFVNVFDRPRNKLYEIVVDLNAETVKSWTQKPAGTQPPVHLSEYPDADDAVRADPRWRQAMRSRGLEPRDVYIDVWAPGDVDIPSVPAGKRLLRALSFYRGDLPNVYDRPIEGVLVTIDANNMQVIDVRDTGKKPVNTTNSGSAGSRRPALKPLIVKQPQGPDFTIDGNLVKWQGWSFRVGYNMHEGLVLHQISNANRSVVYRMALDEMYVPYGHPDENWSWHAALDVGEYNLGQYMEPLEVGTDVPDNAVFIDEAAANDVGTGGDPAVFKLPNAVALYEQPAGVLWDRTDPTSFERDARMARELVVTSSMPIGNYTYTVEYVFGLDGRIDVRVGATGTALNKGVASTAEGNDFGTLVAPFISAPWHQHFFNYRIDLDVDGRNNRVAEATTHEVPSAPGNAFKRDLGTLGTEQFRDQDPPSNRHWHVQSSTKRNGLGAPTTYSLEPAPFIRPYSQPNYPPLLEAQFAKHALWATLYRDGELFAAGDYPNQAAPGEGLPKYTNSEAIDGKDSVLWHTFGLTHYPRPEDYPVMNREVTGFTLSPHGFFDQNPALDLP